MSNPDEKTALEQFGKGDKYFGVATVLATLPGLPMLGHGQVQGFGEKYGMEFRRAMLDEQPDPWLVERHEREIFPLLHRRAWFAEASDFLLYDLVTTGGHVDEAVLAYSNGSGRERSLVIYHTRFGSTSGTIRTSAKYAVKAPTGRSGRSAARWPRASACPTTRRAFVAFRDARTGLEYLRSCRELWERRPGRLARRLRDQRLLGVPRGLGRCRRPVGAARRPARRRGRPVARRRAARAPARADPRAVPGDLRRRPDGRGPRRGGDDGAARRARAAGRGVPRGGRRGDRGRRRPGRDRGPDPGAGGAGLRRDGRRRPRTPTSRLPRRPWRPRPTMPALEPDDADRSPERPHGLWTGAIARRCSPGSRSARPAGWRPAPTSRPRAWPGTTSSGCRAPSSPASTTSGFGEGEAWAITDHVRVLLALPRPSAMRGVGSRRRGPAARGVAGARDDRASRSGSTPGRASSTSIATGSRDLLSWAVRLDAIDAPTPRAAAASSCGSRPVWRTRPRPPATGWTGCATALAAPPAAKPRAASRSRRAAKRPAERPASRPPARYPSRIRRRSDVGGVPWAMHRLEVRPVAEAGRLAEAADDPRLRDRSRAARVAGRDRRPPADLALDVPHLQRAREVGRQLGRRQPRPVELGARLGLLLEPAVDHQRDGLLLGHPVAVDLRVDDRVGDRAQVELPVDEQQRRVVRAVADVHHHLGHVDGPALGEQAAGEDRPDDRRAAVRVDALEVVARAPPRGSSAAGASGRCPRAGSTRAAPRSSRRASG